jgi:sec-independent protein translocase protein TatA
MVLGFLEGPDLIIVLVIVMVLFGANRLPQLARSLGQARKEFEHGVREGAPTSTEAASTTTPAVEPKPIESVTLTRAEYEQLRAQANKTSEISETKIVE